MVHSIKDTTVLNNGVHMPWFGLGVYKVEEDEDAARVVKEALEIGYRSVDTAALYKNERGVGQALAQTDVPREEIFVTTKVWNDRQGYEETLQAFEESREKLGLEYVDLYLIHWPATEKYTESWKALEKLYKDGYVKAIGVSNFHRQHLDRILADCEIAPMVNQVEYHPRLNQKDLHAYCKSHNIQLEAWSPLMRGQVLQEPTIRSIAEKYNKTAAQIVLRWDIQNEVVTIPKSVKTERIKENANIFDFALTAQEMEAINQLHTGERIGKNPDEFDF